MRLPHGFLLFLLLGCFVHASGQQYFLKTFNLDQGLPQSQVMATAFDSKGFLWLATNGGGVAQFNGHSFRVLTTEDGLADNKVNDIFIEPNSQKIWFATWNGISCYDGKSFKNYYYPEIKGVNFVHSVYVAEDKIYIGTDKAGIWCIENDKYIKIPLFSAESLEVRSDHRFIKKTKTGKLLAGSGGGLFEISGLTAKPLPRNNIKGCGGGVWGITEDEYGKLWMALFGQGVCTYNSRNSFHFNKSNGLASDIALVVFWDNHKSLWVGTDGGGLFRINHQDSLNPYIDLHLHEGNGLPSNRVRTLIQDPEGNLWIGTDAGISRFDMGKFRFYTPLDGLGNQFVLSFSQRKNGEILMGTQIGISLFKDGKFTQVLDRGKPLETFIWSILELDEKTLLAGTYLKGILKIENGQATKIPENSLLTNNVIFDLKQDYKGNLWIGSDYGIGFLSKDTLVNYADKDGFHTARVRSVFCDSANKKVWIGTREGLLCYTESGPYPKPSDFQRISVNEKINGSIIFSIVKDNDGYIWFGTYGNGVVRLDPSDHSFKLFSKKDGLSHNSVLSLAFAPPYVWVGTVDGINRINASEFNRSGETEIRRFGKPEGFLGIECNQNAVLVDKSGKIWFGTGIGATVFDPALDKDNLMESRTHIAGIRLFYEKTDWGKLAPTINPTTLLPENLILPHDKNHLTFDFIGISFTAPERVRYKYMLAGLDENWSPETKETFASYPGLAPGKYTFMVISCNNEGIWNKTPASFSFEIQPPFYNTTWFKLLVFMIVAGSVFGFFAYRTRSLRQAKKILEMEVRERTKELSVKNRDLENQKNLTEQKNKEITDSIYYAKKIQTAIIPEQKIIQQALPGCFVIFKPKDIVSGDFYWIHDQGQKQGNKSMNCILAVSDCTGHGVPGGFMSTLGISFLNELSGILSHLAPGEILDHLRQSLIQSLRQSGNPSEFKDGMDIAIARFSSLKNGNNMEIRMEFSTANNRILLIRNGKSERLRTDKQAVGYSENPKPFTTESLNVIPGDCVYLFTDGIIDQFGTDSQSNPSKITKFKIKKLEELLIAISGLPPEEQKTAIEKKFADWKGELEQVDDICLIGIKF
jgi:ligand-binding sensor domain-containing protein/serine phosphatase RsbU (regulator of sigma subunit)